jgi:hypothetical protein
MMSFVVTRFAGVTDTAGQRTSVTWATLATMLTVPVAAASKEGVPLWSAATFAGPRAKENVSRVNAVVLDFDHGPSIADAEQASAGLAVIWHTTWSHTEPRPHFRAVLRVSRPMSAVEYERVLRWAFREFSSVRGTPDAACKDASRIWLLPSSHPGGDFSSRVLEGTALDVDHVLSITPAVPPRGRGGGRMQPAITPLTNRITRLPPRVEALLRSTLAIRQLWHGQKTTRDVSRSGCDYSLARELLIRGVPPAETAAALRLRSDGRPRPDAYLDRTVSKALESIRRRR